MGVLYVWREEEAGQGWRGSLFDWKLNDRAPIESAYAMHPQMVSPF